MSIHEHHKEACGSLGKQPSVSQNNFYEVFILQRLDLRVFLSVPYDLLIQMNIISFKNLKVLALCYVPENVVEGAVVVVVVVISLSRSRKKKTTKTTASLSFLYQYVLHAELLIKEQTIIANDYCNKIQSVQLLIVPYCYFFSRYLNFAILKISK